MWNARKFAGPQRGSLAPLRVCWLNSLLRSRPTFTAVQLVCLAGDVAQHAPVEIAVGDGVLAKVVAAELVIWSQCSSHIGCLVRVQQLG
jgi:hypothetical protein